MRDIIDTFEAALGPFADPGVMRLARGLPETLERPDQLRVLMQGHRRTRVRVRAALVTVVADRLVIATPDGPVDTWPLAGCAVRTDEPRIGGLRVTITTPGQTVLLQQAMPVDEAPRLVDAVGQPAERVGRRCAASRRGRTTVLGTSAGGQAGRRGGPV